MLKKTTQSLLLLSLAVLLFGLGYKAGQLKANAASLFSFSNISSNSENIDMTLFWKTWKKIEEKYVDKKKVDKKKMYYGAIKGMVASVEDPYTFFLTPDENKQSKDDLGGKFEGIGAQLGLKDNKIVIVAPIKGSPAEKAGIMTGDVIAKVNGQSIKGWTLTQTVSKIRGNKGTQVKITVLRAEKEVEFSITRDVIKVESVELTMNEKQSNCPNCQDVAYLKLNQFGENTVDEWEAKVTEIESNWKAGKIKGMVLDLRDNPGGYLDSSVYLAGEFLEKGKLVVKQESTSYESRDYYVERTGKLLDIPLVVLINQGSASASEILSGALRDHKRAKLVGQKSFGKGSVQEALDLDQGAGLHVTVAKWVLPNGEWINGKGIEPDIKVENTVTEGNTMTRDHDAQLDQAIALLVQ